MGKDGIALAMCFCLIGVSVGFSACVFLGVRQLEGRISDLETQTAELNEKVQNLTDWRDSVSGNSNFTFIGTEQLAITRITWNWNPTAASRTFTLRVNNTGTKDVTINQVLVNWGTTGVTQPANIPCTLKSTQYVLLTVTYPYTNGTNYDISVAISTGYKFTNNYAGGQNSG